MNGDNLNKTEEDEEEQMDIDNDESLSKAENQMKSPLNDSQINNDNETLILEQDDTHRSNDNEIIDEQDMKEEEDNYITNEIIKDHEIIMGINNESVTEEVVELASENKAEEIVDNKEDLTDDKEVTELEEEIKEEEEGVDDSTKDMFTDNEKILDEDDLVSNMKKDLKRESERQSEEEDDNKTETIKNAETTEEKQKYGFEIEENLQTSNIKDDMKEVEQEEEGENVVVVDKEDSLAENFDGDAEEEVEVNIQENSNNEIIEEINENAEVMEENREILNEENDETKIEIEKIGSENGENKKNENDDNLEEDFVENIENNFSEINDAKENDKVIKENNQNEIDQINEEEVKINVEINTNESGGDKVDETVISNQETKSEKKPIDITEPPRRYCDGASNFMTVHIQQDDGTVKNQVVTIQKSKITKPFLGGYRHKLTGLEYHNASIQTVPKPRPPPTVELFSRDCQTFQIKHKKVNTQNTTSTQLTGPYLYVSSATDKLLTPRGYQSAEDREQNMLSNIIVIQKYYRRWLAKNLVDEKRKQLEERQKWESDTKELKLKEKEERLKYEYLRRMHPKTKADFDLLYSDLERWRLEEVRKIDEQNISVAEKKALMTTLLDQETDLLARIDRHKIDLQKNGQHKSVHKLLSRAAAPKSWKDKKGKKIELDTPYIIRSRELLEILNSLNMHYLTADERLDVLLTLKHTVKEHECKLTKDIVDLVDREADLIMRNVKEDCLVGLRKRIVTLFLQYCKTPSFNPEISMLLRVPQDSSTLVGDVNYCQYCSRYLRSTEFSLSSKSKKLTICKACARKDNQSRSRQDYSHYRRILKDLQDEEVEYNDGSRVVFIFKQNDIKSLLESVWDCKSILSSCEDLDELVFVRWDKTQHWSPWNCVLLDKDEAEAHRQVAVLSEMYSATLINRIYQKHVIGKNNFGSLEKMVRQVQMTKPMLRLPEITS